MEKEKRLKIIFNTVTIIITLLLIIFVIYGFKLHIFEDKMSLVNYIKKFGIFAPILFIFIQCVQVIFPVIPGGASCLAGVLAFGPILGFIYNEVGLVIGSICAFILSRNYGLPLIKKLFKEEQINKYMKYISSDKFEKIFLWVIVLPGLPDDLLCYISGLSNMTFKKFLAIIILGKPLTLILYSLFINII